MTRYGALTLGLSYACLWFVPLAGAPFTAAALLLLVAGLALLVLDTVAPRPCPCRLHDEHDEPVEAVHVGPLTAGVLHPELVLGATIRPAGAGPYIGVDGPHAGQLDPNTTGPIPVVAAPSAWFDEHRADRG